MPDIADNILALPSKPSADLGQKLSELRKYDCIARVPRLLLADIVKALDPDHALALWVLRAPSQRFPTYSIEESVAATSTHAAHRQNYHAYNPALVKVYSRDELSRYLQ